MEKILRPVVKEKVLQEFTKLPLGSKLPYIGRSAAMLEIEELSARVANSSCSVLITGESGVGKEVFARFIHDKSARAKKPFIAVNCAAIPQGLLESELFGHVKGAFTNSLADRVGRFQAADSGTIFLDEIGDMPPFLQAKLLRVLQDKTFQKLGSGDDIKVDIKVIAATNKNLNAMMQDGSFRSDLYYRLNVVPLEIPPLRERRSDVHGFALFFLDKYNKAHNKHFEGFSKDAINVMIDYDWPGNVRELENTIERACITEDCAVSKNLSLHLLQNALKAKGKKEHSANLKDALTNFKKDFVSKVLASCGQNQTAAAKELGIQRTYLSRLIKELDIQAAKR